jgi:transcriptional regulator with XRE-family HTH domain
MVLISRPLTSMVAISQSRCYSAIVRRNRAKFDLERFLATLDAQRQAKGFTWKQVAAESGVSASSISRMSQGKRPDVETLASLSLWAGINANEYFKAPTPTPMWSQQTVEPLSLISSIIRSDQRLSAEAADALDNIVQVTYRQLSTDQKGSAGDS